MPHYIPKSTKIQLLPEESLLNFYIVIFPALSYNITEYFRSKMLHIK